MQKHRKTGLVFLGLFLACLCIGFVLAKSAAVIGMVTEVDGHAYWHNDNRKISVQTLAELPENAKLVLAKDSKLTVVYLASGQQYLLSGPGVVQFRNSQPVGLSGMAPKAVGAAPVLTGKPAKIDPKKVQTAGQTLVSTEAKEAATEPVAYAAPPPPPAPAPPPPPPAASAPLPPPVAAMSPARPRDSLESKAALERMQAYEAAKRQAEAEAMATRQAKTAETASMRAEQEAARAAAEADYAAERESKKTPVDAVPKPACPPPANDNAADSAQPEVATCSDIEE